MNKKRSVGKESKFIIILIIFTILAFGLGFIFGVEAGVKNCIYYGVKIADKFINISIDSESLANILYKYRGKIEYEILQDSPT